MKRYHEGDNVTATCELCGAVFSRELRGLMLPGRTRRALDRVLSEMRQHIEREHPEIAGSEAA